MLVIVSIISIAGMALDRYDMPPDQLPAYQLLGVEIIPANPTADTINPVVIYVCFLMMLLAYVRASKTRFVGWLLALIPGLVLGLLYLLTWPMLGGLISALIYALVLLISDDGWSDDDTSEDVRDSRSLGIIATAISMAVIWLTHGWVDGILFAVLPCIIWFWSLRVFDD